MQRSEFFALRDRAVGRSRALAGGRDVDLDDGVERGVVTGNAHQVVIEQLQAADFSAAQVTGEALCGPEGNIHGATVTTFAWMR